MGSIILLIICIIFYFIFKITGYFDDKKERKNFLAEKERYTAFYRDHDLRTLTNMPDIYVVAEDNYPREKEIPYGYCYGKTIDVYITRSGEVYHALGCPHAGYIQPRNVFKDFYTYSLHAYRPCSYCKPAPFPDVRWYNQYMSHLDTCRKYGITPRREP